MYFIKNYNRKVCPPSLACRLGRCFCFAEVSTGHPHPLRERQQAYGLPLLVESKAFKGKTCFSYDLRYVMENCTDAKTSAEYLASRSSLYTYNMNGFVTDDKNTFCVELVVGDKDGRTVIRDSKTKLKATPHKERLTA